MQQYISSKRVMKTGKQAMVFQGRIGDNAESISVLLGQWKKETAGTVLSELDITMSTSIVDGMDGFTSSRKQNHRKDFFICGCRGN